MSTSTATPSASTQERAVPPIDPSCIFCRIASQQIPAPLLYQDDLCVAFRDIHPQAPTHLLVIPRAHVRDLLEVASQGEAQAEPLMGRLLRVAADVARQAGLADGGFRLVANTGADGGQSVFHLHLHVLGGRPLGWPPG
jgi:histidine triad (HIT) family protein